MSNTPEEFEKLQKLMKLKRHEVPPPGYFNNFSTRVVNRIERDAASGKNASLENWVGKFLRLLETNPFAAGIFGVSVCGLLVSGIAWSEYRTPVEFSSGSSVTMDVADNSSAMGTAHSSWKTASVNSLAPSTSAVFGTNISGALFTGLDGVSAQPVSYPSLQ